MPGTNSSHEPTGEAAIAIVIDPAVPPVVRTVLTRKFRVAQRHPTTLPRRGALIPFRETVPEYPAGPGSGSSAGTVSSPPRPLRVTTPEAHLALGSGIGFLVLLGGALLAVAAGSAPALIALLGLALIGGGFGVRNVFAARAVGWTSEVADPQTVLASDYDRWYERQSAAYYHRRYVVPGTDILAEHRSDWERAVTAAEAIRSSYVLQSRLVDFEQVTTALPQRLWDIASGLARLGEVRARQSDSIELAGGSSDPYVSEKVAEQEQRFGLAYERIMSRVAELESFAALVSRADEAKQRELAVEQLGEVDDLLLELLASTSVTPGDAEQIARLRSEAEAVIEQAVEAAQHFALDPDSAPVGPSPEASSPRASSPQASSPRASSPQASLPQASLPQASLPQASSPGASQSQDLSSETPAGASPDASCETGPEAQDG